MGQEMPKEEGEFTKRVVSMLRQIRPHLNINEISPGELVVEGRRLDLKNLYRMVNHEPQRGKEIAENYLTQLFSDSQINLLKFTLREARERIMPRIQSNDIFNHLTKELVACIPFVNNTSVVFVYDLPTMTVSLTNEQVVRWGTDVENINGIARENLKGYGDLEVELVESKEGAMAAILSEQDGFDAARLLTSDLYRKLAPQLGGDFYVAIPARDIFLAFSIGPEPFVRRMKGRVTEDYKRLPYPITPDLFYVTRDGVAGTIDKEAD